MWPFKRKSKTSNEPQGQAEIKKPMAGSGRYSSNSYSRGGGAKWPGGLSAITAPSILLDHARLRANARDAYHDTPQARALIERYADTVADIGLQVEPAPIASILGITDVEAERWASEVEARFDMWARNKSQHRAGAVNWYQSHRLYQIFQHRDNDIFTRFFYNKSNKNLLNPLQFDFIDPNQIQGCAFTSSYAYQANDDGIIRNESGEEIGYKIAYQDPANPSKMLFQTVPAKTPNGRLLMIHGFCPEYAGQGRGYSRLAHALQDFENLTDFSSAQIQKAINQSMVTMFVKPSKDNPASNAFEGMVSGSGAGPAALQYGETPNPSDLAQNVGAQFDYCDVPEVAGRRPGSWGIFNLREGEDLKSLENTAPSESFNTFVDAFTSYLSSSMSMPVEVLLMKFNQNYSASRASLILFWRVAQIWREEMASDYLNPTYQMWTAEEIAAGRIIAPGFSDPIKRAAWLNCRWIGSPMPNIDPMRTAEADKLYIELGAQTLDRVARNLNGSSGAANRRKLAREFSDLPESPWGRQR